MWSSAASSFATRTSRTSTAATCTATSVPVSCESFRPALGSGPPGIALDDAPVAGISAPTINTFGEAADGRIYYAQLDGGVYRLDQGGP